MARAKRRNYKTMKNQWKQPTERENRQKGIWKVPEPVYDMDNLEHVEGGKMAKKKYTSGTVPHSGLRRPPKTLKTGTLTMRPGDFPSPSGGKSPALDFTHALMTGNPRANEMVNEALRDPEKEPSLADQFIASMATLPKIMNLPAKQTKIMEPYLMAYRNDMRRAHRFVLDDDFTRYAAEVNQTLTAEKVLARLQYATLPYDIVWIEYDLHVRLRVMRQMAGLEVDHYDWSKVSRRLGLLLHRLNDTDAVAQIVCEFSDRPALTAAMVSYYFSLAEHDWTPHMGLRESGCKPLMTDTIFSLSWDKYMDAWGISKEQHARVIGSEKLRQVGKASLWGFVAGSKGFGMMQSISDLQKLHIPSFLERHGELGYSRMYRAIADVLDTKANADSLAAMMAHEVTEFTGTMRWVVTILGMLNEVPISLKHVQREGSIRVGLTGKQRYLDFHKVTLRLPKKHPVQYIERRFRNVEARRRRAHEVRSHWRTYVHEVHCRSDEHDWVYDYEEGYRLCGKCEAFGRLIHEHVRGDPSLGWVKKEYVIKKEGQ